MNGFLEHFRFVQPGWLLLLVPSVLLLILRRGKGAEAAVIFPNLGVLLSLGHKTRRTAWSLGIPLAYLSLLLAILALARPVWRDQVQRRDASGIDIVIAFDVSLSMSITDFLDRGRAVQRIQVAKKVVDDFISRRTDDRIGLVAFAGRPRDASPITLDHQWLRSALDDLRMNEPHVQGTINEQGTAIGSAIAAASNRLDARDSISKVIVLITDGASNSGKISPLEAAEHAKTLGIRIYTIAIGTEEGRVPGVIQQFPRQEFDLPTLRKIASLTGGEHYWAQTLKVLESSFRSIDELEKTESSALTVVHDEELFLWFLMPATLVALAAALLLALRPPPVRP